MATAEHFPVSTEDSFENKKRAILRRTRYDLSKQRLELVDLKVQQHEERTANILLQTELELTRYRLRKEQAEKAKAGILCAELERKVQELAAKHIELENKSTKRIDELEAKSQADQAKITELEAAMERAPTPDAALVAPKDQAELHEQIARLQQELDRITQKADIYDKILIELAERHDKEMERLRAKLERYEEAEKEILVHTTKKRRRNGTTPGIDDSLSQYTETDYDLTK